MPDDDRADPQDPLEHPTWPLTDEAIDAGAHPICPIKHRADPRKPCDDHRAISETVLMAAWPVVARTVGVNPNP